MWSPRAIGIGDRLAPDLPGGEHIVTDHSTDMVGAALRVQWTWKTREPVELATPERVFANYYRQLASQAMSV